MGYEKVREEIAALDNHIAELNLKYIPDAEITKQLELVRVFLEDEAKLSDDDLVKKWDGIFKLFYDAQLSVQRLSSTVSGLLGHGVPNLRENLEKILRGSLTQGGEQDNARDTLYEFWIADMLADAGFIVRMGEPDLTLEGNGLSQKIGVPCKYPSSMKKVHDNITKGYKQLADHNLKGFVAIGYDQLLMQEAGLDKKNYIDFDQSDYPPMDVIQAMTDQKIVPIVDDRKRLYPSEVPINELLLTISMSGFSKKHLTSYSAVAMKITDKCEIADDVRKVFEAIRTKVAK